jgi:V/A-type H+-transporting ATPase subunit D
VSGLQGLAATRMNLLRAQRRLGRVEKGVDLLRRKREALVTELFQRARPAVDARETIVTLTSEAYPALLEALAQEGSTGLRVLGWPTRDVRVEIEPGQVWGNSVSDIIDRPLLGRTLGSRGTPPGTVSLAVAEAASRFEALADLLLDAAPREMLIRRLGEALAQTSRQVNTLDRRVAPELRSQLATMRRTLEEREREEHLRLKHLVRRRAGGT